MERRGEGEPQPAVLSSAPQESNAIIVWPLDHSLTSSQLSYSQKMLKITIIIMQRMKMSIF